MRTFKYNVQNVELENEVDNISIVFEKSYDVFNELKDIKTAQQIDVTDSESNTTYNVTLVETSHYYFVEITNNGTGYGMYSKDVWSREDAINDQAFLSWEN